MMHTCKRLIPEQAAWRHFRLCATVMCSGLCETAVQLVLLLTGLSLVQQLVVYHIGLVPSQFYPALATKNAGLFTSLLVYSSVLIAAISVVKSLCKLVSNLLYVEWRKDLTCRLHQSYLREGSLYRSTRSSLDNPDQRITQDVDKLCKSASSILVNIIIVPLTIVYYTYRCALISGYIGVLSIYGYFVVATVVNRLLMKPITSRVIAQNRLEGDFRFKHVQLRIGAEAVCLLDAERTELIRTGRRLSHLLNVQRGVALFDSVITVAMTACDYIGSILSYVIIAIPIFAGSYDGASETDLTALVSRTSFVCMYLVNCFTTLIDLSGQVAELVGYVVRVGQLLESLTVPERVRSDKRTHVDDVNIDTPLLQLVDVSFARPDSDTYLVKNLNIKIYPGDSVFVQGSTGCGKSSLIRVIFDLWPVLGGKIIKNFGRLPSSVYILPQKPFLTDGTLLDQIRYPHLGPEQADIGRALQVLQEVGLEGLLERIGGLHGGEDVHWSDILSPGETQRLVFSRVLYHQPRLAFLDEATSALSDDEMISLYLRLKSLGTTIITVSHSPSLMPHHRLLLKLFGDGTWDLSTITS